MRNDKYGGRIHPEHKEMSVYSAKRVFGEGGGEVFYTQCIKWGRNRDINIEQLTSSKNFNGFCFAP